MTLPSMDSTRGVYGIGTAAEFVGMGAQNLRAYERRGLIEPERTEGGTRRYSPDDLDRLRRIGDPDCRRAQPGRDRPGPRPGSRQRPATRRARRPGTLTDQPVRQLDEHGHARVAGPETERLSIGFDQHVALGESIELVCRCRDEVGNAPAEQGSELVERLVRQQRSRVGDWALGAAGTTRWASTLR
jgi:hypothetical protein